MNDVNKSGDAQNFQASNAAAITPADGADLPDTAYGIYVGGAGNITVDMIGIGANITFLAVPVGTVLPIIATRVYSTGTTATNLVALY